MHVVEVAGGQPGDRVGQPDRGLVAEDVADGIRQAAGLLGHRGHDLVAPVADVGDPDPGDRIEQAVTVDVPDVDALGPLEDRVGASRIEREEGAGAGGGARAVGGVGGGSGPSVGLRIAGSSLAVRRGDIL